MQQSVRLAKPNEADMLSALAFASKAAWGYVDSDMAHWRDELRVDTASLIRCPTFVIETDGFVAGFCQVDLTPTPAELVHFWIHPAVMHCGLGGFLLAHCLGRMRAQGLRELHIDADPNAERFYLRSGAIRVGVVAAALDDEPLRVRPQLRLST